MAVAKVQSPRCPNPGCDIFLREGNYIVKSTRTDAYGLKFRRVVCKGCGETCRLFTISGSIDEYRLKRKLDPYG